MINVQQFDDETLVPRPFPGDVPKEPLEDNKDLPQQSPHTSKG